MPPRLSAQNSSPTLPSASLQGSGLRKLSNWTGGSSTFPSGKSLWNPRSPSGDVVETLKSPTTCSSGWLRTVRNKVIVFFNRYQFDKVRRKSGIRWPHDVMRHCYGSYHVAMHDSADKTSLQMGHRGSDVLFSHYRDVVDREDAEAFWQVLPRSGEGLVRLSSGLI